MAERRLGAGAGLQVPPTGESDVLRRMLVIGPQRRAQAPGAGRGADVEGIRRRLQETTALGDGDALELLRHVDLLTSMLRRERARRRRQREHHARSQADLVKEILALHATVREHQHTIDELTAGGAA